MESAQIFSFFSTYKKIQKSTIGFEPSTSQFASSILNHYAIQLYIAS
jgi:hypothetical protein